MYNTVWDKRRVAFMLKTSSVHSVISVEHWIVMDTDLYVSKLHIKIILKKCWYWYSRCKWCACSYHGEGTDTAWLIERTSHLKRPFIQDYLGEPEPDKSFFLICSLCGYYYTVLLITFTHLVQFVTSSDNIVRSDSVWHNCCPKFSFVSPPLPCNFHGFILARSWNVHAIWTYFAAPLSLYRLLPVSQLIVCEPICCFNIIHPPRHSVLSLLKLQLVSFFTGYVSVSCNIQLWLIKKNTVNVYFCLWPQKLSYMIMWDWCTVTADCVQSCCGGFAGTFWWDAGAEISLRLSLLVTCSRAVLPGSCW